MYFHPKKDQNNKDNAATVIKKISSAEVAEGIVAFDIEENLSAGEVPEDFLDPISYEIIRDPVIFADTTSANKTIFERSSAEKFWQSKQGSKDDPFRRGKINSGELVSVPAAEQAIKDWIEGNITDVKQKKVLLEGEEIPVANLNVPFKPGIEGNELMKYLQTTDPRDLDINKVKELCQQGYDPFAGKNINTSPFYWAVSKSNKYSQFVDVILENAHPQAFADTQLTGGILQELVRSNNFNYAEKFAQQLLRHGHTLASLGLTREVIMQRNNAGITFSIFLLVQAAHTVDGSVSWKLFENILELTNYSITNKMGSSILQLIQNYAKTGIITEAKAIDLYEKVAKSSTANTMFPGQRSALFVYLLQANKYDAAEKILRSGDIENQLSKTVVLDTVMKKAVGNKNNLGPGEMPFDFNLIIRKLCMEGAPLVFKDGRLSPLTIALNEGMLEYATTMLKHGGDQLNNDLMTQAVKQIETYNVVKKIDAYNNANPHDPINLHMLDLNAIKKIEAFNKANPQNQIDLFDISEYTNSSKTNDALAAKVLFNKLQTSSINETLNVVDQLKAEQAGSHGNKLTSKGWATLYKIAKNHILDLEIKGQEKIDGNEKAQSFLAERRTFKAFSFFKTASTNILKEAEKDQTKAKEHLAQEEAKTESKMTLGK